jgi:flagellar biosynthesis/type III secretory pathway M-ring protein FliF/YscJ
MQRTRKGTGPGSAIALVIEYARSCALALVFLFFRGLDAHAEGGVFEEGRLSLWSFATFIFLVVVMLAFSVVIHSVLSPKKRAGKEKRKTVSQAALSSNEGRKALPPAEASGRGAGGGAFSQESRRTGGSMVSVKKQVARHSAEMASLKAWCEEQDPERALAVIRRWLKAEAGKSVEHP